MQDTGYFGRRTGVPSLECKRCPGSDQVPTKDGKFCISCPLQQAKNGICECPPNHILIERDIDGKLLPAAKCVQCTLGTFLDNNACKPCLFAPILQDRQDPQCNCTLVGGLCLPTNYKSELQFTGPTNQANFVDFPLSDKRIDSAYFREHFEAAAYMCSVR